MTKIADDGGNYVASQTFVKIENNNIICENDSRTNPSPPPSTIELTASQNFVFIEEKLVGLEGDDGATTSNNFVYII